MISRRTEGVSDASLLWKRCISVMLIEVSEQMGFLFKLHFISFH